MLKPGDDFDGYVVDQTLGHGGYATVYRAHATATPEHPVALKVLADEHRGATGFARLEREFEFAYRVRHPHVVAVQRHGPGWLAMQFIDGGTVDTLQTRDHRLVALAQIADALDFVHVRGIVHSDVKPSNILVNKDFTSSGAVLIDFGVAHAIAEGRHRHPSQVQASLPYTAPEVLQGQTPTAAADEYGLACTAVELLIGAPPFAANTSMALVDAHLHQTPPRVSRQISWIPRAFDSVLAKAMAKSADARYESCTEFVEHIRQALR